MKKEKKAVLLASGTVAAAALAGLLAGSAYAATPSDEGMNDSANKPVKMAAAGNKANGSMKANAGKHDCKGKNDCKGQGGCKTGDNGCKGKNSCKGKGGCKTSGDK